MLTLAAPVSAETSAEENPETAEEYFEAFRAMEDNEAYESYGELETIRSFALQRTQVGEFTDEDRAELEDVHATLREFETAYERAEAEEYEASFEAGRATEAHIEALAEHDESQAELARLALSRFYEELGDELREEIDDTERTPTRLEYLSMTASAYERAGQSDQAAEFRLQAESQTATYERDSDHMNDVETETAAFLETCGDCGDPVMAIRDAGPNPSVVFDRYQRSQSLYADSLEAERRADIHGLDEREEAFAATNSELREIRFSLAVASSAVLLGYGLFVGLVSIGLLSRVFVWRRTVDAARIDSVVRMGDDDV